MNQPSQPSQRTVRTRIGTAVVAAGLLASTGAVAAQATQQDATAFQPGGRAVAQSAAGDAVRPVPVGKTRIRLLVAGCEGCKIQLHQYDARDHSVFTSRLRPVREGRATFEVPTGRTRRMSITLQAPWEGTTGYATQVVLRYPGFAAGQKVTVDAARRQSRAHTCWAGVGPSRDVVTLPLRTKKVTVAGNSGPTAGTLAWLGKGARTAGTAQPAWHGVAGTQEISDCR